MRNQLINLNFTKIAFSALALILASTSVLAESGLSMDARINLKLNTQERAEFLSEMRQMLASIQGVMQGIGEVDREKIAQAARLSGNKMARATPASVRAKLPQAFKDLGGPTHMMFEELAVLAETDDMDSLTRDTAKLLKQCMACHAAFRVH